MEACGRGATLCRHTGLADSSLARARSVGRIETFVHCKSKKEEVEYYNQVGNLEHLENAAASARSALAAGVPPTPHRQLLWGQQVRSQR